MPVDRRQVLCMTSASLGLCGINQLASKEVKKPIKIGQIGVGHGHASKLSVYRDSPDFEVVGIVEPDPTLRKRAEGQPFCRGLNWMKREQLLETPGLQAVLIETRVSELLENAKACVLAGKHIHIDKPAGESLLQLRQILDIANQSGLLVQMGYMYRYNPAIILLHEFLKKGWLGDVFEVHCVMSKVVHPEARLELAGFNGGMMFELGCHLMDLVIRILGRPSAVMGFHRHSASIADSLLDNTMAVLEYPKAVATIKSTALEVEGFNRRHLVVCGTEGTFHIQPLDNPVVQLSLSKDRGPHKQGTHVIQLPQYARYVADAVDMAKVIRGEKLSDFDREHDMLVQETLFQACGRAKE